ncbi:MAG TPA: AbrB/MazE/SpoVT family DNA-binding domain-containing protein [Thermomicrobiaceae bacterium]|nr:AbrB/MazE/SpoVT family DNA-binding domain-containing protein [Thermomicrobiaceae bacterium]
MAERKLVRVQEKGQVTLPVEFRKRLGLKKGDLVAITETPEGVLITPQEVIATRALDQIGAALRERGLSLEELIESGRDTRDDLLREQFGIDASDSEG